MWFGELHGFSFVQSELSPWAEDTGVITRATAVVLSCLIKSMIEWLISITCIFNDDMRNISKNIKLNHPYSRTGGWKLSSFFLVSTDQANEWICGEQHRRPDASQTLQNETRGRVAEPGRSERTGEDCLHFSENIKIYIHLLAMGRYSFAIWNHSGWQIPEFTSFF